MHADIVREDIKGGFDESNPYIRYIRPLI